MLNVSEMLFVAKTCDHLVNLISLMHKLFTLFEWFYTIQANLDILKLSYNVWSIDLAYNFNLN